MASTPVGNVGPARNLFTSAKAPSADSAGTSFQDVWNKQTQGSQNSPPRQEEIKVQKKDDASSPPEALKQNQEPQNSQEAADTEETGEIRDTSEAEKPDMENDSGLQEETDMEAAMEVLGAALNRLMQQISQELGITVKELNGIMKELGMEGMELLMPDKLSQLVLAAGGADMMELLTNEGLYRNLQNLNQTLEGCLEQVCRETGMTAGELQVILEQAVGEGRPDGEPVFAIEAQLPEDGGDESLTGLSRKGDDTFHAPEQTQQTTQGEVFQPVRRQENGHRNQDKSQEKGQQAANTFVQNLADNAAKVSSNPLEGAAMYQDTDTEGIMRQIMDYMKLQVKTDMSSLEMQLHPESLGTLNIQLASKGGAVTAQFVTESEAVKAALESQMVQLKESFSEQGVKVEAIEVTVQTHEFERNLDQGRRQNQERGGKTRTRRLNLNLNGDMADPADMSEAEQIAADMMAASGNTVDYTA